MKLPRLEVTSSHSDPDQSCCSEQSHLVEEDSHFPLRKSHGALSSPLFNGSIAVPTPSCSRALFPYGYCTIRYLCGCLADINAYFPCQPSKLNWIGGGEWRNERLSDGWPTKKERQGGRARLGKKLRGLRDNRRWNHVYAWRVFLSYLLICIAFLLLGPGYFQQNICLKWWHICKLYNLFTLLRK